MRRCAARAVCVCVWRGDVGVRGVVIPVYFFWVPNPAQLRPLGCRAHPTEAARCPRALLLGWLLFGIGTEKANFRGVSPQWPEIIFPCVPRPKRNPFGLLLVSLIGPI